MTSLLRQHKAITLDPSYDDDASNAMYLWCINTGELYPKFLELVETFSNNMDDLVRSIYVICLGKRQALAKAEEDLCRVSQASCMGAAIAIADYYINIHR